MKKLIPLLVSGAVLITIISGIKTENLISIFLQMNRYYLAGALLLFIPQILVTGLRWMFISRPYHKTPLKEALMLTLSGNALNLILPSKMGDLAKALFLIEHSTLTRRQGLDFVLLEKGADMISLTFIMFTCLQVLHVDGPLVFAATLAGGIISFTGIVIYFFPVFKLLPINLLERLMGKKIPGFIKDTLKGAYTMRKVFGVTDLTIIFFTSIFIWSLHLTQFYLFFNAVGIYKISIIEVWGITPVAIYAGLLPFTLSGIGTRDAAFLALFKNYGTPEHLISIGLFATLRYIVPGLIGWPFATTYMKTLAGKITIRHKNST